MGHRGWLTITSTVVFAPTLNVVGSSAHWVTRVRMRTPSLSCESKKPWSSNIFQTLIRLYGAGHVVVCACMPLKKLICGKSSVSIQWVVIESVLFEDHGISVAITNKCLQCSTSSTIRFFIKLHAQFVDFFLGKCRKFVSGRICLVWQQAMLMSAFFLPKHRRPSVECL
jgi:hypothetical protein